jgi:nicotinamidase-related amidase
VVETVGLENRCTGNRTGGSNPSPSAIYSGTQRNRTASLIPVKFAGNNSGAANLKPVSTIPSGECNTEGYLSYYNPPIFLVSVKLIRIPPEVEVIMQRAFGLNIPQTLDDICDPARLALIVYDMQVGIVKQIENGQQITDKVLQVLNAARKAGIRIVFTRHMSLPRGLMGVSQFRMAMTWQRSKSVDEVKPWFLRDAPGFHLIPQMTPLPSEAVFDKITMSAFEGTPLNIALRDCGIDAVAIVGIAMEIGIEPTARHGADLGYIPLIVKDACGFGHRDAAERSIANLEFAGDALFTSVEEICAQFGRIETRTTGQSLL